MTDEPTTSRKPPTAIPLRWCPICGRTDRTQWLGDRHDSGPNERCDGTPVTLTYTGPDANTTSDPAVIATIPLRA